MILPIPTNWNERQIALFEALRADGFSCFPFPESIFITGRKDHFIKGTIRIPLGGVGELQLFGGDVYAAFEDSQLAGLSSKVLRALQQSAEDPEGAWAGGEPPALPIVAFTYSVPLPPDASVEVAVQAVQRVADEAQRAGMLIWRKYHALRKAA
jgi:hypothetical protein